MNSTALYKKTLLRLCAILVFMGYLEHASFSQIILFNNGAKVFTGPSAVVFVNGGFQNDNSAATPNFFENNGTMYIATSNSPGSVFLTTNSILQGNGTYLVEQNWTNDAAFLAGSSTVNFNGTLQEFITSTNATVTTFNNLILSGTGSGNNRKKTLQLVDAKIGPNGTLNLNDRELETLTNSMFVLNPSPACVTNNTPPGSEGFISSSFNLGGSGSFSRVTNSASPYLFPTGSSVISARYRPVIISPASAASNTFTARLGNNDASNDGFTRVALDTTMCIVNPMFYHEIKHSFGNGNADIDIFYDETADGSWDGMAKWNSITQGIWNEMGTVTASTFIPLSSILKSSWADFSNSPFILSRKKPAIPSFSCAPVCANSSGNTFSAIGTGSIFTWTSPVGTTITNGQNTNYATIDWGALQGPVTVTQSSPLGCESNPVSCVVLVNPAATANAGSAQTICANSSASLSGAVGGSAVNGTWSGGTGIFTPNNAALNAVYTPSLNEINTGSVILTLTSNDPPGACPATASTITITINPAATINAGPDQTICIGSSSALAGVFGGAATSGTWSGGGGTYNPNSGSGNAVYTPSFAETETGTVSLTFTSDDPAGICPPVSDIMVITIMPSPTSDAGPDQNICAGSNITLAGTIGGSATSGTWSGGSGNYSPDNSTLNAVYTPSATEFAADSVILTLTTNNPIGLPCSVSASNVIIYFYKKPVVNFSVDDSVGCPVHCVSFTDLSVIVSGTSIASWSWNFGDYSPDSHIQNPSHCYSQMGLYNVSLTAVSSNNCSAALTIPQMVHVYPIPAAEFYPTPTPATLLDPTVTLNDQSSSDVNYWFWSFGDGDTSAISSPNTTHVYPNDSIGTYQSSLVVQNAAGCSDTVIHEIIIGPEFSFFIPTAFSPNNDGINDFFRGVGMGIVQYELMIFDRWGNLVFYSNDLNKAWDGKANHGTEAAQEDLYIWKVKLTDVFRKKYNFFGSVTIVK